MSLFSDVASTVVTGLTGVSPSDLQAQATLAEQQISQAVQAIIALEALVAVELIVVIILLWKKKS